MKKQYSFNTAMLLILILIGACKKEADDAQMTVLQREAQGIETTTISPTATLAMHWRGHRAGQLGDLMSRLLSEAPGLQLIINAQAHDCDNALTLTVDGDSLVAIYKDQQRWVFPAAPGALFDHAATLSQRLAGQLHLNIAMPQQHGPETQRQWAEGNAQLQTGTLEGLNTAIYHLKAALKNDDTFVPAWTDLALAYFSRHSMEAHPVWLNLAQEAALRVEKASPASGSVLLARIACIRGDWKTAQTHLQCALTLNPFHAEAMAHMGRLYLRAGLYKRAAAQLGQAMRLRPQDRGILDDYGWVQLGLNDNAMAELNFKQIQRLDAHAACGLALAHIRQGHGGQAMDLLKQFEASPLLLAMRVQALITLQRHDEALGILETQLAPAAQTDAGVAMVTAAGYARLGRPGNAVALLNRADSAGYDQYPWIEADPFMRQLRQDPRAQTALANIERRWKRRVSELL